MSKAEPWADCYHKDWFAVSCNEIFFSPKHFLRRFNLEVLEILLQGTVHVNHPIYVSYTNSITKTTEIVDLAGSPFVFSQPHNRLIAIGCNIFASMKSLHGYDIAACISYCEEHVPFINYVLLFFFFLFFAL